MKKLFLGGLIILLVIVSCRELSNPVDPESDNYQDYPTVSEPNDLAIVYPVDGGSFSGTEMKVTPVVNDETILYEIRIATIKTDLETADKLESATNIIDISEMPLEDSTQYWWQARASVDNGITWGNWTIAASFTTNFSGSESAATPTFNPTAGTYSSDQNVTINCDTEGAAIYYTTDGSTPSTSSSLYSDSISVSGHEMSITIKAIAVKAGNTASAIGTASYAINYNAAVTPTFSPIGGIYSSEQSVTISCATEGATIYYTTDGSDPVTSSTRQFGTSPVESITVTIDSSTTVRAIATASGYATSAVGSATYTKTEVSPTDGSTVSDTTPLLNWDDVTKAAGYQLQVNTSSDFNGTDIVNNNSITDSQYTVTTELSDNTTYYWRIKTRNSEGIWCDWSNSWSFSIGIEPEITTASISDITYNSATCGGTIADNGVTGITACGACWDTSSYPTISDNYTTDGSSVGTFESSLTGLTYATRYYVRAYVTTDTGTTYGRNKYFTTSSDVPYPDIDEVVDSDVHDGDSQGGEGNDDSKINVGEEIDLEVEIKNNGDGTAYNIVGILELIENSDKTKCTITDEKEKLSSLSAGNTDELDDFDFTVQRMPDDGRLEFGLTITYEDEFGNSYEEYIIGGDLWLTVYE